MNKQFCIEIFSPQKQKSEETVKIKGLHYVNEWYDHTKTIHNLLVRRTGYIFR